MDERIAEIMGNPWGPALIIFAFQMGLLAGLIITKVM